MKYDNLTKRELIHYAELDAKTPLELALLVALKGEGRNTEESAHKMFMREKLFALPVHAS